MTLWKPVLTTADISPLGSPESYTADFKARVDADSFEIAKDVAAFSNTHGGTVLVGAAGGDTVAKFLPVDAAAAKETRRLVDEAVRDRCRPAPFFEVKEVAHAGALLVAVNVWPSAGQLVGVRIMASEIEIGSKPHKPQDVYVFPFRVGTNTRNLTPEQLPMFMDPKIRRVTTALQPHLGKIAMIMSTRRHSGAAPRREAVTLTSVDILENVLRVDLHDPKGQTIRATIPLDAVATVCPTEAGCYVYIDGFFEQPIIWTAAAPAAMKQFSHYHFDPTK